MIVDVKPGRYVIAVSGGVDSVCLLHLLKDLPDVDLVVAHFDHGIREDSAKDRLFVQKLAESYGLPFEYEEGRLGKDASEATARQARYYFLHKVQKNRSAEAIITAHHQDDVLETAILNMLRGTGRKGLTALKSSNSIIRPLLNISKLQILDYAKVHNLAWREDISNQDVTYLRNYIRHKLLVRLSDEDRSKLEAIVTNLTMTNQELDELLGVLISQAGSEQLDRQWFGQLSHAMAREVLAEWLRLNDIRDFDRQTVERLVVAAKTAAAGKTFPVQAGHNMEVGKEQLLLA